MANPNLGSGARAMEQAIENCKANIKWMERNEGPISEWLTEVTSGPIEPPEPIDVRLPLNVYPLHYNLELKPDFYGPDPEAFSFEGKVEVFVECRVATNRIVLHVNKLTIEEGTVRLEKMGAGWQCSRRGVLGGRQSATVFDHPSVRNADCRPDVCGEDELPRTLTT